MRHFFIIDSYLTLPFPKLHKQAGTGLPRARGTDTDQRVQDTLPGETPVRLERWISHGLAERPSRREPGDQI